MKKFIEIVENFSIEEYEKKSLICAVKNTKKDSYLKNNSFLFMGDAGTGKTYLAEKFIQCLNMETIVFSCEKFSFKNQKTCGSFEDVIKNINENNGQIIFLDGLNLLMDQDNRGWGFDKKDKRVVLKILELINNAYNKFLVITATKNIDDFEALLNKISSVITFDIPNINAKKCFIRNLNETAECVDFVANNTVGYTYNDIKNMLKLANFLGDEQVNNPSIRLALKKYKPKELEKFDVISCSTITFSEVIGREKTKQYLTKLLSAYKKNLNKELRMKRNNLLLFHGPAGTGKTYMVKALAGEAEFQIINIKASNLDQRNIFSSLERIVNIAKKYRNCILFIDEADKLFGKETLQSDNDLIGEFNKFIDGVDSNDIKSIIILSVNDISRLGGPLIDRFIDIRFDLPEQAEREEFCKRRVEDTTQYVEGFDYKILAKYTKDMSFRGIERLWDELMFEYIGDKKEINEEVIMSIIKMNKRQNFEGSYFG